MIHIAQYLCPNRHCIIAMLYDRYTSKRSVEVRLIATMFECVIDHRCGICGSTQLEFEHGVTKFKTMAEAEAEAKKVQAKNLASRLVIDQMKREARNN